VDGASGAILDANRAAQTFYGWDRETLRAMNVKELNLVPPETVEDRLRKVKTGQLPIFTARHRLASGELRDVEVRSAVFEAKDRTILFSIMQDVTERVRAETEIRRLLAEKELLLREVHHRIKNNMAVINGLIEIQARRVCGCEAAEVLYDASRRVTSMMLMYDRLYRSGETITVHARSYFQSLLGELSATWSSPDLQVEIHSQIAEATLDSRLSFPLGLIVTECITNACKYAFEGQGHGRIEVSLAQQDHCLQLRIADNGVGLPEQVDFSNLSSFGLMLVKMMANQIQAEMRVSRAQGTRFEFDIPL